MLLDDNDIMCRVQAGQTHLFDELVRRYRVRLEYLAYSKLGDSEWAEDVVQEAFLAAYAARDAFNPRFAFRTWLWTILLNLCRRQWQQRARRPREHSISQPGLRQCGFEEPPGPESGLSVLLGTEQREQVHCLLARLPEPQADALCLRFFADLPFAEIALAMNSSVSAAKQRVKQGLLKLAAMLREDSGDFS